MSEPDPPRLPHAGVAHHGRLPRRAGWRSLLKLVAASIAVVLVAGASVAAIAVWQLQGNIETFALDEDEPAPPTIAEYEGGFNLLIVGADNSEQQGDSFGERDAMLNDVNMVLHVAEDGQSATLVSIPRDLMVSVPECENGGPASWMQLNNTLELGGVNCVARTIQELTGLDIQFAGLIDFLGVIAMSDAIGGVEVCIDAPIFDPYTGLNLPTAGPHTLQGAEALAFLRTRHGVGDGSDLGRISSQQVYLSSLVRTIKSDGTLNDLGKLYGLARAATEHMELSSSLARTDILVSMALVLNDIPLERVALVQFPTVPIDDGNRVAPDEDLAAELFAAIGEDRPLGLDAQALDTGHGGSSTGEETPPPADPSATPAPTASDDPAAPLVIPGLKGQTAATRTCSVAN